MEIRWLTAFLDLPADRFDDGVAFWLAATASDLSSPRGDRGQFATLLPPDGDPYLRVQRLDLDGPRVHLDLHVASVPAALEEAVAIGAEAVVVADHAVLRSPGGFTFCLVPHVAGSARPEPRPEPAPHLVDQICLDIAADRFDDEVAFWSELTGWRANAASSSEFVALDRPPEQPLRLLLQRLGPDDPGPATRAHLDLACGDHRELVAEHHATLGARIGTAGPVWRTMTDPAGMVYCVTGRDPVTGVLPDPSNPSS